MFYIDYCNLRQGQYRLDDAQADRGAILEERMRELAVNSILDSAEKPSPPLDRRAGRRPIIFVTASRL